MRRWGILAAAVAMQICLGGIYAWSVFVPSLQREHGLSMRGAQGVFGGCILTFTMVMVVAGRFLPQVGPRRLAGVGGLLVGLGYLLASFSGCFWWLFLSISVVSGIGIGMTYVCPIVTCMKWFPHRRGLVTGVTVAGFGGGAVVLSTLAAGLLDSGWCVLRVFRLVGLGYGVVVVVAALALVFPSRGVAVAPVGLTAAPAFRLLRTVAFWLLAGGMFSGTFAGLVVIGALESIGDTWGVPHRLAVASIGVLAVGNAAGRVAWGWIADRLGLKAIPGALLFLSLALLLFKASELLPGVFLPAAALVGFGFGACFVIYAATAAQVFGTERVGSVYPFIFLAYGLAAMVGPSLGGMVYDVTGSYRLILVVAAGLPAVAAGVFFIHRRRLSQPAVANGEGR